MYYVNKIVGWCLSPLGILFLGLGLGRALCYIGEKRASRLVVRCGRCVVGAILVLTWILGCGITTRFVGASLEGDEVDVCSRTPESFGKLDAIVLLGGGMGLHAKCGRAEMFGSADRVWTASRLWQKLKLPITVSGGAASAEKTFLKDFGVPEDAMLSFASARNTEEEARMIWAKLSESGADVSAGAPTPRILLVTSAWHMPRSKMLFERVGFDVVAAPADYEMTYILEEEVQPRDFFPSADAMIRNSYALKEWVARFFYWLKG